MALRCVAESPRSRREPADAPPDAPPRRPAGASPEPPSLPPEKVWGQMVEKQVFGTAGNRSPSIAHMVWDIVTSVYSSPKAFRSAESNVFVVLSCLGGWAAPYRRPTKSDDPGDAGTETKVVEPTGRTS